MSNVALYLSRLRATKIYREQLVTTHVSQKFKLTSLPRADRRRHILVMEMRGNDPNLHSVLTENRPMLSIGEALLNEFLFIVVDMTCRTLHISNKYYRKDRQADQINISITVQYRVADAETLMMGNRDSLTQLELLINNALKHYLDKESSAAVDIATLQTSLEKEIMAKISNTVQELGLHVNQVFASVELTEEQRVFFNNARQRERNHKQTIQETQLERDQVTVYQLAKIRHVDKLLQEITIFGIPLKRAAESVDPRMLLNFYTLEWEEAINALISRITQILEGDDAKQKVELLKKIDADEMDIAQVKEEIVNSIKQSLSTTPSMHNITAAMVLGQSSAQQQPLPSHHQNTNGVGQKPASDSSKDNQDT